MNFQFRREAADSFATPCLVLPLFEGDLSSLAQQFDDRLSGLLQSLIAEDGFKAKPGATRVVYAPGTSAPRIVLLGLGEKDKLSIGKWRTSLSRGARAVRALKRDRFALAWPEVEGDISAAELAQAAVEGITLGLHVFNDFKTDEESKSLTQIEEITFLIDENADENALQEGAQRGEITGAASLKARGWVNLPSNLKTPNYLALEAEKVAREGGLKCEVWDESRIQQENMNLLYAVGMGSDNPPRFIILEHAPEGHENDAPLILVGKGMSFDSGGYSLKPSPSMEDMKDDMSGAAVVLGVMSAIGQLKPAQRIIGLVPSAENMISGRAQRPGDIVTGRNGLTVEVLNTDAEGRLILADALTYASELKPRAILDFATLTGAIGIALGQHAAGLFCNDDDLAQQISEAGDTSGDRVWRFPIWDEYADAMKGSISDLKNISGDRYAGSITGAKFLERFVEKEIPWAHLDIAAVSLIREERALSSRGATGFGVRLVLEWLRNLEK